MRPFHKSARSASSWATRIVRAPCVRPISEIRSVSSLTAWGKPETSIKSAAAASVGKPAWIYASTASRHSWSIISKAAGTIPAAMIALTVSAPACTDVKSINMVFTAEKFCIRRTQILVVIPNMPSLPMNAPRRSRPIGSGSSPPSTTSEPSDRTTSQAKIWLDVTPSARQCGPPELFATFPPMVQLCWLLGSGAKCKPKCATSRVRSRLSMPGSIHAVRLIGSTEMRPFIFAVEITTAPSSGVAPPASPVPDPRATKGWLNSAQMRTTS
ncbi:unannotated protein [freshwater metagenome]|uniref:Unannotated protein n=1 Tax=freshwater metagenome TaxID=449393 RepID=A0A6J7RCG1_9ZZZZ